MLKKNTKRLVVISFVALLFPIYIIVLVFYVEGLTNNHAERRELFYSFFPYFLQNGFYLRSIAILCCAAAASLSFVALPTQNKWLQAIAAIIMGIACLFGAWLLFSLM